MEVSRRKLVAMAVGAAGAIAAKAGKAGTPETLAGVDPFTHSHAQPDVTDLVSDLTGKAAVGHGHLGTYAALVSAPTGNTTTDRATLQAAITASGWPANQATLVFSAGEYKIATGITLDGGGATSTPELVFQGSATTISTTTVGVTMFTVTNSIVSLTRVKFRGILFMVNAGIGGATAVALHNAELCEFVGCGFLGSYGIGISIDGISTYNRITGCEFTNLARGIYAEGAMYLHVTNCDFGEQLSGSPLNWIELGTGTAPVTGAVITGNTFYSTGATLPVVRLSGGNGCTIIGNTFDQSDQEAIWISYDGASYGHTIAGNTFSNGKRHDVYINGGRENVVSGNIFGARHSGVPKDTFANVRIRNTFGGNAGSDNIVVGNHSKDTTAANTYIVEADAACQNLTVIGNSGLASVSAPHASNVVIDNAAGIALGHTGGKIGFMGATPVARAAAIPSPSAPSAGYVQAEAAAMKTAVDAIRVALTNIGITA